jgi:hypothetical protein
VSHSGTPKITGSERMSGSPRLLLLDLDNEEAVKKCLLLLPLIEGMWELACMRVWPSASKGTHMLIELQQRWDSEWPVPVFAVQAFLGSDPVRERLGFEEYLYGDFLDECNFLWKPPKCKACGEGWQRIGEEGGVTCHCPPMDQRLGAR